MPKAHPVAPHSSLSSAIVFYVSHFWLLQAASPHSEDPYSIV
jgi:hypothetical protein